MNQREMNPTALRCVWLPLTNQRSQSLICRWVSADQPASVAQAFDSQAIHRQAA